MLGLLPRALLDLFPRAMLDLPPRATPTLRGCAGGTVAAPTLQGMSLRHALLGLLAEAPASGYDLRKRLETSLPHLWPADQAGIYRALRKLVDDDLVELEQVIATEGRPDRRVHRITEPGREELATWLTSSGETVVFRDPALLRIALAANLHRGDIVGLLYRRTADLRAELAELEKLDEVLAGTTSEGGAARWRRATVDLRRRQAETELAWLRELRSELVAPAATSEERTSTGD